jgi:[acyl-carrier-protein] S-malonyltransferase
MVTPFVEEWPEAAAALDRIGDDTVESLLFDADADTLAEVEQMHRSLVSTGLIVAEAVERRYGVTPAAVAGHSLGHVTAVGVAGMASPAETLELAVQRGRLMANAEETDGPGEMLVASVLESETVAEVVADIDGVAVGTYNHPHQTVVSGRADAVERARAQLEALAEPVRTTTLDVRVASHSPVMATASQRLAASLEPTQFTSGVCPVVSDVTGEAYTDPVALVEQLPRQLVESVRWPAVVDWLDRSSVDRVIEFPPVGSLTQFVRRCDSDLSVATLTDPTTAETVIQDE